VGQADLPEARREDFLVVEQGTPAGKGFRLTSAGSTFRI